MENSNALQMTKHYLDLISGIHFETIDQLIMDKSLLSISLKILLKRLNESIKSYLLLMDKECFMDAFLIAGHIMENCAIINYIKNSNRPEETSKIYTAKSSLQSLRNILEFNDKSLEDENIKKTFLKFVDYLEKDGHLAVNKKICDPKQNNIDSIMYLKNDKFLNKDKITRINHIYDLPKVIDYIKPFSKMVSEFYKNDSTAQTRLKELSLFYTEYCKIKHCNLFIYHESETTPGLLTDSMYKDLTADYVFYFLSTVKSILGQ